MLRFQWPSDWVGLADFVSLTSLVMVLAAKRIHKAVFLSVDIASSLHGTRLLMDAEKGIVETVLELEQSSSSPSLPALSGTS